MNQEATAATEHENTPQPCRRTLRVVLGASLVAAVVVGGLAIGHYWVSRSYAAACRQAERDRDWPRLERVAEKWSWWHGSKAEPWIFLAQAAQEQGDLERAVAVLDRAPPSDPLTPAAWLEQSTLLFGPLNRPLQGAESCERALAVNPRLHEAYRRVIYFYNYTLQRRKMVRRIYDAIANDCDLPEMYLYLIARDYLSLGNAYDETTKWLKGAPDEELFSVAQAYAGVRAGAFGDGSGQQLDADGKRVSARKLLFDQLLTRFPKNLELLVYSLQASSADGDVDQVAKVLSEAPPESVEDGRFWRFKGWLHNARGEPMEAASAYRKSLEINPYDFVSHQQLAAVERRLNRKQQAERRLLTAKEGRELRQIIIDLPDIAAVDRKLLQRVARHAADCGDNVVADKLYHRTGGM